MRPVERQDERAYPVEIEGQRAYPFLFWAAPLLRWLPIDEFPAGPFLVVCAIIGGVVNYVTGTWLLKAIHWHDVPLVLLAYSLFGAGIGMTIALKLITWLADHSPD